MRCVKAPGENCFAENFEDIRRKLREKDMSIFQLRLKNCIQAIIELEPGIRAAGGNYFDKDFSSLKSYLELIDKMDLAEDEVEKLEKMTTNFIAEIGMAPRWRHTRAGILQ